MSLPIDPSLVQPTSPLVYAPLTLSGAVIGLNIDRVPRPELSNGGLPDPAEQSLAGTLVTQVNLTPRLVAKLLTESYGNQFFGGAPTTANYAWVADNPQDLLADPDFIQFNPEFAILTDDQGVSPSQLVVEEPASDVSAVVWQWIMADPEAKAWLDGQPDQWGMKVNPYYSTSASVNPSGTPFDSPALDSFPKSDPYCWTPPSGDIVDGQPDRPLCAQDWDPYVNRLVDAAADARSANTGADTTQNGSATSADSAWTGNGPERIGTQWVMSITDSADAARYGLQSALLSRAGDDGVNRQFVAPDTAGLTAGETAMLPSAVPNVLLPNPASTTSGAYPLTMLTYAVTAPVGLDSTTASNLATFLDYAAGPGQTPGLTYGTLPLGYVPLPSSLAAQTTAAAATILNPSSLKPTTTTTVPPTTTTVPPTTTTVPPTTTTVPPTTTTVPPTTTTQAPVSTSAQPIAPSSPSAPSSSGDATTASAPVATTTPAPPVTVLARGAAVPISGYTKPSSSSSGRSPGTPVGAIRWFIPIVLLLGVSSGAGLGWPKARQRLAHRH